MSKTKTIKPPQRETEHLQNRSRNNDFKHLKAEIESFENATYPHKIKIKVRQFMIAAFIALTLPFSTFAQLPNLGTAINFAVFTGVGALGNTGISTITGDIGTHDGAITGFGAPTVVNGSIEQANVVTALVAADVQAAYNEISAITPTDISHAPAFGGGETLLPGVYYIGGAGSIGGDLNLDADGDPDVIFIFQFAGAFTTGASSIVTLLNGASACNIFWVADGEIAMAALTEMKGTLIANNGAISMGADGVLEGRMLSTVGAASVYNVTVTTVCAGSTLPVEVISFKGYCENQYISLEWKTASEKNNDFFTVERSENGINWEVLGVIEGAGNSSSQQEYMLKDITENTNTTYYKLKQTDFNEDSKYEPIITVNKCKDNGDNFLIISPNPSEGQFELHFNGNKNEIKAIDIFDSLGKQIFSSLNFQSVFDLSNLNVGSYYMRVLQNFEVTNLKIVVSK